MQALLVLPGQTILHLQLVQERRRGHLQQAQVRGRLHRTTHRLRAQLVLLVLLVLLVPLLVLLVRYGGLAAGTFGARRRGGGG
jgi:hypothetical protein